ncbi:MAG: tetratricopeptide repeat protein, partial [Myxococcales bacterium]|nr:tetratricopeptide repeat protein [Myxococcales bacterium]
AAEPCAGGPARVAAVWGPARAETLRRMFGATGLPQAEAAWRGAVDQLDAYGRRWALAHRDACLATRVRGEQSERLLDLRMACLDNRLADLDAVVAVLAAPDRQLVIDAEATARRLPSVAACDEAAARRLLPALPDDPAVRGWVQAIEAQLAAARARLTAGRYAEGRALVAPVRVAAAVLGDRPLEADVLLVAGRLERATSDLARSRRTLAAGLRAATAGRHDAAAAELALEVMRGAIDLDYGDEVDAIVADAQAWVDRLGDPRLAARLLDLRGSLALRRNDFAAARALLRQALTTYRVEAVDDPLVVASVLRRLSLIDQLEGNFAAADASGREAVDTIARALGPWHPEALGIRSNLAVGLGDRGAWAASLAEHAAILALREQVLGPAHLDVAMSLYGVARAQLRLGRLSEAAAAAARVLAIRAAVLPPDAIEIGEAHGMIGRIALAGGRAAEARPHFVTAAACYAAHLGLAHPARAVALGEQAAADLALGDAVAALATARAALALDVADYPAVRAELTLVAVQALTARGPAGVAEARPLAERARADFAAAAAGERIGLPALEAWLAAHPPAPR